MNGLPTIRDVAKRAGVAVSTASLALNGSSRVRGETRLRVLEAARELDYHPHSVARNLANGRARTISLLNPTPLEHLFASSGFFLRLIQGMHRAATEDGYTLSLSIAESEEEAREDIRTAVHTRSVDGFVITNPTVSSAYLDDLKKYDIPFVFIGRPVGKAPYVDNDNIEVSRLGVRHLIECGHRRIAFLNGPDRFTFCQDRLLGYRAALEEAGLPYDEDLVWQSEQTEEAAYRVVRECTTHHEFNALFSVSGIQAMGAMRAFREHRLAVPEDIAVVCVDDAELTQYFIPPLTAVALHEHWLGYWAVKLLIRGIEGKQTGYPILIPGELVIRASSGPNFEKEVVVRTKPDFLITKQTSGQFEGGGQCECLKQQ